MIQFYRRNSIKPQYPILKFFHGEQNGICIIANSKRRIESVYLFDFRAAVTVLVRLNKNGFLRQFRKCCNSFVLFS